MWKMWWESSELQIVDKWAFLQKKKTGQRMDECVRNMEKTTTVFQSLAGVWEEP